MFAGMSTQAAQTLDPNYTVLPVANWFFMIASTFLITAIGTLVTDKLVEPRLTPYVPDASEQVQDIAENEKRGMRFAGITALVYVLLRNYSVISIKNFEKEHTDLQHLYIDGSKFEANANKYSWVWKKATEKSRYRLFEKITSLFQEINL